MTDHTPIDTDAVALWMTNHIKEFQGPISAIKFILGQSNLCVNRAVRALCFAAQTAQYLAQIRACG